MIILFIIINKSMIILINPVEPIGLEKRPIKSSFFTKFFQNKHIWYIHVTKRLNLVVLFIEIVRNVIKKQKQKDLTNSLNNNGRILEFQICSNWSPTLPKNVFSTSNVFKTSTSGNSICIYPIFLPIMIYIVHENYNYLQYKIMASQKYPTKIHYQV